MGEFLLVTIQVDLHDRLATRLQDDLGESLASTGARGVLIDISALNTVDSFIALQTYVELARRGLRLTFEDHGPGIADVERAMTDGYTTAGGLGLGLGGTKRLVDEFDLASNVGMGTRVRVTLWT
jgi:signal transduction histidine kinase